MSAGSTRLMDRSVRMATLEVVKSLMAWDAASAVGVVSSSGSTVEVRSSSESVIR